MSTPGSPDGVGLTFGFEDSPREDELAPACIRPAATRARPRTACFCFSRSTKKLGGGVVGTLQLRDGAGDLEVAVVAISCWWPGADLCLFGLGSKWVISLGRRFSGPGPSEPYALNEPSTLGRGGKKFINIAAKFGRKTNTNESRNGVTSKSCNELAAKDTK